jgi:hypothetical protein
VAVLLLVVAALVPVGWSFTSALTKPGTDPLGVRATEWVRDHGGRALVTWAENVWYEHHQPKRGGLPRPSALPALPPAALIPSFETTTTLPLDDLPLPVRLLASPALPGEGQWVPAGRAGDDGRPLLYTTFMRPDSVHTSLVTGLAWMDPARVRFELYSGYQQPGGSGWQLTAPISAAVRPGLVAAFNSGFKLQDSRGGYLAEGRLAPGRPLVDGVASLIITKDGRATVGMWGRDAGPGPDIEAVRQNLSLLIDRGREAPDLDQSSQARWGWTVKNAVLVWRSGVGVDAAGNLVYAGGNGLSVKSLADVLLAAGCVRAMELDINSQWVHFFSYTASPTTPGGMAGSRLIPDMRASTDTYFQPSSRDFIAVFSR